MIILEECSELVLQLLALVYLACGRIDGFWAKGLNIWDVAGGLAIVEEANGKISSKGGKDYSLESQVLIASNTYIHDNLIKMLSKL